MDKIHKKTNSMKIKQLTIILTILIGPFLIAQEQLRIEYELTEPEENFKYSDLPNTLDIKVPKRYYELILNKDESIWKSFEKVDNNQNDGTVGRVTFFSPYGDIYKNVREKVKMFEANLNSKKYIVKDSLQEINWKIMQESKEILNIQVNKAIYINKEKGIELIAWYAPKLNFKNGPDEYWNLPGLILEIENLTYFDDNSKMYQTYTATKIETLPQNKKIIKPTKGAIITQKELDKILEENFDKMKQMEGEGVDKD
ncbi:GLPGLI family protein [Algoriella sp.]|uniref:GLPGLI family protein n=1 Tax=Algoriella sp. TaxID=1872434 RepID=UPI001B1EFAD0|nr:GLPGLI family protein [Algoriella sp.]MBO6213356.1 GLPGLI family protein [Algoriella sp.]